MKTRILGWIFFLYVFILKNVDSVLDRIPLALKWSDVFYTKSFRVYSPTEVNFGIYKVTNKADEIAFNSIFSSYSELVPVRKIKDGYMVWTRGFLPFLVGTVPKYPCFYVDKIAGFDGEFLAENITDYYT